MGSPFQRSSEHFYGSCSQLPNKHTRTPVSDEKVSLFPIYTHSNVVHRTQWYLWASVQEQGRLHVTENNAGLALPARSAVACGYLSVKSRAVKGSAGGAGPAGSAEPGGGGGLREGSAQGGTPVPLPQSSPKVTPGPEDGPGRGPREPGPAAFDFAVTPKSSSSKVTHPRGGLALTVAWACR